jgi:hypothetical protein
LKIRVLAADKSQTSYTKYATPNTPSTWKLSSVNYPALKDGACREHPASQVDQGKRSSTRTVYHRSLRLTAECFLSSALWKTGITLAKGKAPKVPVAA